MVYPPTWPLPALTAPPGATKAKIFRHSGFVDRDNLHDPYYVEAARTDDPHDGVQYLICFYYSGTAKALHDHVESCLSAEGYTKGASQNKYAGRGEYGVADYEILRGKDLLVLSVQYHGWQNPTTVEYLVYIYPPD